LGKESKDTAAGRGCIEAEGFTKTCTEVYQFRSALVSTSSIQEVIQGDLPNQSQPKEQTEVSASKLTTKGAASSPSSLQYNSEAKPGSVVKYV